MLLSWDLTHSIILRMSAEVPLGKEVHYQPEVLKSGDTLVVVVPEDGGRISRVMVGNQDFLMPDQTSVFTKSRRGGSFCCLPQFGPLTAKELPYQLSPHGFGRKRPWRIVKRNETSLLMELTDSEKTKAGFPFESSIVQLIQVGENNLINKVTVTNLEKDEKKGEEKDKDLPLALGFHPYLFVPLGALVLTNIKGFRKRFDLPEPRELENYQKSEPLEAVMFPRQEQIEVYVHGVGTTIIRYSPNLKNLFVWADPDLPCLCFEGARGTLNALLDPYQRIEIPPSKSETLAMNLHFIPEEPWINYVVRQHLNELQYNLRVLKRNDFRIRRFLKKS
jgi:galactose mutarotase-like enzyme